MNEILLGILIALCVAMFVWGLAARGRIYTFPFLISAATLGWAIPQLIGLCNDAFLPPGALAKTMLMTILCIGSAWIGFVWPVKPYNIGPNLLPHRLAVASLALSLMGSIFFYKISLLPEQLANANHQWTGIAVAYDFFARVLSYGFVLALLVWMASRSRLALLVVGFDLLFYFHRIVIAGRRWGMIELTIALGVSLWLYRRIVPPRILVVLGIVVGALVISGIGEYRRLTLDPNGARWSEVTNIDLVGNFTDILKNGSYELRNSVYAIEAIDRRAAFDFGAFHWNMLVFNYVPAQIVGEQFKNAMKIDLGPNDPAFDEFKYTPVNGTTMTGMADAFGSFWYFGCLKFFLIAIILRKLYLGAKRGDIACQCFYIILLAPAMQAITHHTQFFFSTLVHLVLFMMPVIWICGRPSSGPAVARHQPPPYRMPAPDSPAPTMTNQGGRVSAVGYGRLP